MALLWSRRLSVGLCALAMIALCGVARAQSLADTPMIPVTSAMGDYGANGRWNAVMARFAEQQGNRTLQCVAGTDPAQCPAAHWAALVAALSKMPLRDRVLRVNAEFNNVPYIPAEQNWGDPSYWETPYEFLAKGGQCQDYAIAKFLALVQSGVPESALRFVVVHDSVSQLDHAITLVNVDGEDLVLDNQVDDVLPASSVTRYTPYYSLNGTGIWVYAHPAVVDTMAAQIALRPGGGFTVARY